MKRLRSDKQKTPPQMSIIKSLDKLEIGLTDSLITRAALLASKQIQISNSLKNQIAKKKATEFH